MLRCFKPQPPETQLRGGGHCAFAWFWGLRGVGWGGREDANYFHAWARSISTGAGLKPNTITVPRRDIPTPPPGHPASAQHLPPQPHGNAQQVRVTPPPQNTPAPTLLSPRSWCSSFLARSEGLNAHKAHARPGGGTPICTHSL